ncbi:MAG TPA: dihydroneopterin aldolase [Acidimicrobiales bacterium]|nr:dihydroneopterin aldolase [Acidimicrobiales bacterium]
MNDRIELRGLRVVARVGVLPHEQAADQPLEVDIDLDVDLAPAGVSDALTDTVDYGAVLDAVAGALRSGHVDLLESLAARTVAAVFAVDDRIATVDLAVRKLRPPVPHDLASTGVHIVRRREQVGP